MISCAVVDDEPKAIDVLVRYISRISFLDLKGTFRDPLKALEYLQEEHVQLIFMDVNMPHLSGIDLFGVLRYKPSLIFTTAYSEYAVESYSIGAVDYLLKPIKFNRFIKAVTRVKDQLQHKSATLLNPAVSTQSSTEKEYIYVKSGSKIHKLNVADLLYIKKDGNYLVFHTGSRKVLARQNMNRVFQIVSPKDFLRIHKSYVVALRSIKIVQSNKIVLLNDQELPVGVAFRDELMKHVNG